MPISSHKITKKKMKLSPVQWMVLSYMLATVIAAILLALPISLKSGVQLSFVDLLFTAVSAISVTGLTTVDTADTFTTWGILFLMLVFQFGAVGLMTLGTYIYALLGKNITLKHRQLIMIDQNRHNLTGMVQTVLLVFRFAIILELIGGFLFGSYFWFKGYADSWLEAYFYGLFHAVSSFTNAGFDLWGDSLFRFSRDYFVQTVTMLLIVAGALGFPVWIEIKTKLSRKHPNFRFSLYAKLTTAAFMILLLAGAVSILWLEHKGYFANLPWHEKIFHALFYSVTPRSAGLTTLDVNVFSPVTLFLLSILMFIGASPSSTGGGIRTTTFAVVILTIITFMKGKSEVRVFKRRLNNEDIMKSFIAFSASMMLVSAAIIFLDMFEIYQHSLIHILFEVCSAFGTTGLSIGLTAELSTAGKYLMMVLMFIGRIGIISFLWFVSGSRKEDPISYPEERVLIG